MRSFLFLILFHCFFWSFSQIRIEGQLKSITGDTIPGASITIRDLKSDSIISYDITNIQGKFSIEINSPSKRFRLKVQSMGYKTLIKTIENKNQKFDLLLEEDVKKLQEVIVKSAPITRRGDTLNYTVSAFSKQGDRSIGDVLKKMPGIEVLDNGKILYQGTPINKYYIEGLDLLGGKYNLANENLPYKEVSKVQLIENHQPIKMLTGVVYSNQAAINIKLKNSYTFTGQAVLGSGFALDKFLWEVNLTPMLFSRKVQFLGSYQTNNTGNNIANQLKIHSLESLLAELETGTKKQDWLSITKIQIPHFPGKRWIDNNVHLLSANFLQKLTNNYELRLNLSYLNDYQQQKGFVKIKYYLPLDTIAYSENIYNQLFTNTMETHLTFQKNTNKNFLKNIFHYQGFWDSQKGAINLTNETVQQNLQNQFFKISNHLETLLPVGRQIFSLESYIGFNHTPQSLQIQPGQFKDLINNGIAFEEVTQNVNLHTFFTKNSLSYTKAWRHFTFNTKVSLLFEKQNLESKISSSQNEALTQFDNYLDWIHSKATIHFQTQYNGNHWHINISTPLNSNYLYLEDEFIQKNQHLKRVSIEPNLSVTRDLGTKWKIGTSGFLKNRYGKINQMYYNFILQNYRTIQRIDAPFPEIHSMGFSGDIKYRNPIKALFLNFNYSHIITKNNLLYNRQIFENGAMDLQAVEKVNFRKYHDFSVAIDKYYSHMATNFHLSASYNLQNYQQILNYIVTDILNENRNIEGKIDTEIKKYLNISLESSFQVSMGLLYKKKQNIKQQTHQLHINYYPMKNHFFSLKMELIKDNLFNGNNKNFFADLFYRYNWKKKNIDLELHWNNIFNTRNYHKLFFDEFSYMESNFTLRPSQVLFKIKFTL